MCCPEIRFWQETDNIYSFYKYFGAIYPELLINYYQSYGYDILLRKLLPSQFAQAGRLQRLPDLFRIDVRKISLIFHEGFHYHLQEKGCGSYQGRTIKAMFLEEGVATVFGYFTASLFIEKIYGAQSIESQNDAVADFDGLVSRLQAAGATVEVTGTVAQPFFATRPGNHC